MRILDTPQWNALTVAEKNHVNNIYGNDTGEGYTTALSPGARKVIQRLEARGLVTVEWRERDVTLRLREQGWSSGQES